MDGPETQASSRVGGRAIGWNLARWFLIAVVAAFGAVVATLGWDFARLHPRGSAAFVVSGGVVLLPFALLAEWVLRSRQRTVLAVASAHLQAGVAGLIVFKYGFSNSLNHQFSYNAGRVYAVFLLIIVIGVAADSLLRLRRGSLPPGRGLLTRLRSEMLSAASIVAGLAIATAAIHQKFPFIPTRNRIDFLAHLSADPFFSNAALAYYLAPLAPELVIPEAMQAIAVPESPGRFCVVTRDGKIYAVEKQGGRYSQRVILDLSSEIGELSEELGLAGAVFGPKVSDQGGVKSGQLFVWAAFGRDGKYSDQLSSFQVNLTELIVDVSSRAILIDQTDPHPVHNGGGLAFGSDGYLYLSVGDGGPVNDGSKNSQVLDRGLFSGILRIDVYGDHPEAVKPIERQPKDGTTRGYFIPKDNPFVGTGVLDEFWAVGLRNPFRIYSAPTGGGIWVADVGQAWYEEVDLVERGDNLEWSYREGPLRYKLSHLRGQRPAKHHGSDKPPVMAYDHQGGRGCVIGGAVYQGSEHPELDGRYVFGDFLSGELFSLAYSPGQEPRVERLIRDDDRVRGLTSVSRVGGELLMTYLGGGKGGTTLLSLRKGPRQRAGQTKLGVEETYQIYCARCHGAHGAPTEKWTVPNTTPPRDFTDRAWQGSVTDESIAHTITKGGSTPNSQMPAWGAILSTQEVSQMVALVRTFGVRAGTAAVGSTSTIAR
ncbi:MAG: PQQ-dependent sugar dehydrogenase [Deltaproteobacteria bacterium]|nr:PQQ-dependent sugar dehydrogenase [Deltaproteobacteria bacterium]